jgi:hypothetical protein
MRWSGGAPNNSQGLRTAPGLPEAVWFEPRRGWLFQYGVVALLGFGRRDVADGLQVPPVVEPIHPFGGGELDPRSTPVDDFGPL